MLVDDAETLIVAAGLGVAGTDLIKGALPATPDTVTALTEATGIAGLRAQGEALPVCERPRIMVRTRGAAHDYATPRTQIERIYQLLAAAPAGSVNGTPYLAWEPVQPPYPLGQDDNDRWVFTFYAEVWKAITAL